MPYRVVELRPGSEVPAYVRRFSSAYEAVDFMTAVWFRGAPGAGALHLMDDDGVVLLGPDDVIGACALAWRGDRLAG